jgi:hypothetical protein
MAVAASVLGVSTASAAGGAPDSELAKQAAAAYNSEADVRSAVQSHASGLLQMLADRGLVEAPVVSSLPVSKLYTSSTDAYFAADEGTIVFGTVEDGEPRTRIEIKTRVAGGQRLVVVVKPQIGESYAVLPNRNGTGGVQTLLTTSMTGDVGTQGCTCLDSETYCGWSCIEGRCQGVEFNYGLYCSGDSGSSCSTCWTEDDCSSCSEERTC